MRWSQSVSQVVKLFTRANCGLCTSAKQEIEQAAKVKNFKFEELDIAKTANKIWFDKYAFDVPVIHVSKRTDSEVAEIFMHKVTKEQLLEAIERLK